MPEITTPWMNNLWAKKKMRTEGISATVEAAINPGRLRE
jgi:hypothetical protein